MVATNLSSLQVAGVPTIGTGGLLPFTGNYWFVNAATGSDGNTGQADAPFATLGQAYAKCVDGNNDVVFLTGTATLTASLAWAKNCTHLIGLCAPAKVGKIAQIVAGGTTPFSYLVNVTGTGCYFANFATEYGFPTTGATTPVAWLDGAGANCYDNVEFMGFGDATASTGTANQTGARAFKLTAAAGNVTWRNCVFGTDAIVRNAANYTMEITSASADNMAVGCDFVAKAGASGAGGGHMLIGSGGIARWLHMVNCRFANAVKGGATAFTQAFSINSAAGGTVLMDNCTGYGFTNWETTASTCLFANMSAVASIDSGIALSVTPT